MCGLVNETRMIELQISGISLKIYILLHKWAPYQFILIDMTFNFIFRRGLPGTCLYQSKANGEMVLRTISLLFDTFIKTFSWKSLTKNKVKGHIYQDKLVMGSIYVIRYRFSRKSRKIRISIILGSLTGLHVDSSMLTKFHTKSQIVYQSRTEFVQNPRFPSQYRTTKN